MIFMHCEECGVSMQWRCTNTRTNESKFKCPNCGRIQVGVLDLKPPSPKKEPNFYIEKNGSWIVKRTINKEYCYVGTFSDEETAKEVVDGMNRVGWEKSKIPDVLNDLGIHKVKRSWVKV